MKKILLIILLLITLPAFAKNTILILGDSLSAGYGIDTKLGWVSLLESYLHKNQYDYQVINSSISGATTSNGVDLLPGNLKKFSPKITIIELGGNDGLRGIGIATIKSNLQKLITAAKSSGSKVLVIGVRLPPNYGEAYTSQFERIFTDLAKQNNVNVLPSFLKSIDENDQLMQQDRIHPSSQAQQTMLENVLSVLKPML